MNDDLISRKMAMNAVWNLDVELRPSAIDAMLNSLNDLPSAQPERKKGRWITKSTNGEMFDVCSACGYVEWDEPNNYCPNCGAEMVNSDE